MPCQRSATISNGSLGLQGIQERGREAVNIVHTPNVLVCTVLSREITIALCNPVPQQTENEPAPSKRGHKQEEDKAPSDLHKGGPEIHQVRKVVAVLDVAELNVAVSIFGDQASLAASVSGRLDVTLEQLEHPEAGEAKQEVFVRQVDGQESTDGRA